jgi:hypothetical protein
MLAGIPEILVDTTGRTSDVREVPRRRVEQRITELLGVTHCTLIGEVILPSFTFVRHSGSSSISLAAAAMLFMNLIWSLRARA